MAWPRRVWAAATEANKQTNKTEQQQKMVSGYTSVPSHFFLKVYNKYSFLRCQYLIIIYKVA